MKFLAVVLVLITFLDANVFRKANIEVVLDTKKQFNVGR